MCRWATRLRPPQCRPEEAIVSAATAWTQGSNVYAAMTPGHSGLFDADGDLRALRAIGGWLAQHKPFLVGSVPYADVAIVRGNPSPDLRQVPSLPSLWEHFYGRAARPNLRPGEALDGALRQAGYFTEFTGTAFPRRKVDWPSFRLLVMPENAVLDNATVSEIRNYVSAGGKLLAVGHASLFDQSANQRADFALKRSSVSSTPVRFPVTSSSRRCRARYRCFPAAQCGRIGSETDHRHGRWLSGRARAMRPP